MKIDKIDSPVYVGRLCEKGVLSIGFDVSDWLLQFPTGTFTVDFKPDYLSESFSLPPTQYRVADDVLTIDIEANITGKAGRASLGIRMLVGDSVDKRSAIIPVVIAESLPPATGEMPEPVQAWIDGAVIVIGQAQTATVNANEATHIANEQELLREGAESDRRRDETARDDAEVIRIAAENTRNNRYETAEDVRDDLYDDAEGARDDLYGLAETARDGLYSSAEGIREVAETGRKNAETSRVNAEGIRQSDYVIAEGERDSLYSTAENNRDGLYNTAENARGGQYTTAENARDSTFGIAEGSRVNAFNSAESGRASAEVSRNSAEGLRQTAETNRIALHNKWSNPEAVATTLEPNESATVNAVIGETKVTFNFGIPEGIQGFSAYEVWKFMPENAEKTEEEYIAFLKKEALEAADSANEEAGLANTAATNANSKAELADTAATNANTKAGLANDAAILANSKAELADTKAGLANDAADLANTKAGLADTAAINANASALAAQNNLLWRRLTANPASFYPVPQSPLYVRASGEPIQEGTGDPSPENIRPILPWKASGETVKVQRTGKNLFPDDFTKFTNVGTYSSFTLPYKNVVASVTVKPGKSVPSGLYLLFSGNPDNSTGGTDNIISNGIILGVDGFTINTKRYPYCAIYKSGGNAAAFAEAMNTLNIQVEAGSSPTPYTPYIPDSQTEITLTAPQDIYGGWMDNEGKGLITHANIPSYAGESVPIGWKSSVGSLTTGAQVVYPLAVPTALTITPKLLLALPQTDRITPRQNVVATDAPTLQTDYAKSPIQESNEVALAIIG